MTIERASGRRNICGEKTSYGIAHEITKQLRKLLEQATTRGGATRPLARRLAGVVPRPPTCLSTKGLPPFLQIVLLAACFTRCSLASEVGHAPVPRTRGMVRVRSAPCTPLLQRFLGVLGLTVARPYPDSSAVVPTATIETVSSAKRCRVGIG
jgi:hypothetical protein